MVNGMPIDGAITRLGGNQQLSLFRHAGEAYAADGLLAECKSVSDNGDERKKGRPSGAECMAISTVAH